MRKPLDNVKSQVRELRPYTLRPDCGRIKINQNENPFDAPAEVKQETLNRLALRPWSRYPAMVPEKLHQQLAKHSGWVADGILAGNGSNELIQALMMVTLGDGRRVLINEPTFALYRQVATILGAKVVSIPLNPEFNYNVEALLAEIQSSNPEVTIICSPNNPTGCVMPGSALSSLLKASTGLVVVDEAYFEFADETAVALLQRYSNLVVLRTFSKAMAMAGLRVGYLLAAPDLVREVTKAVLPYNLNVISQTAAEVALEMYESALEPLVRVIRAERERLFRELSGISGLSLVPSRANFILVRSGLTPSKVYQELLQRDILIRDLSNYPMLHDGFRVSVGTPEENDLLIEALGEIFARKEAGSCQSR